ncbi:DUF695 domain-containing protein [Mucilaginibacter lutimaris]|uniref:DUF695 domain-containing protein n=1 Tax=Mucilaginibacter lutimaris TaxID=931629 RepID=A0ABW2ZCF2_9SPHI
MKLSITSLLMLCLISCNAQFTKNAGALPEKFTVVKAKLGSGKAAVGSFNMAYKNYSLKESYPWCLKINMALDLKNVTENGLPVKAESDIANKYEDYLINNIRKLSTTLYVGHLYNDSFLDIYIYLDEPEKVNEFLKAEVGKKDVTRQFAYEIKEDANWETVADFLM